MQRMKHFIVERFPKVAGGLSGRTALVTGGAGFIGSHLSEALVACGVNVRVLDDLSGGFETNLPRGGPGTIAFTRASILDDTLLRKALAGCDFVFHQAALVSVPESVEKPEKCLMVNVEGTQRVLLAARDAGVKRVMFAASAAAYGNTPSLPSKETDTPDVWSPYAMSKVSGELLLRTFARCYGLSCISLRYFNIFGPRQDPKSPYAAVISAFADVLSAKKQPRVLGDGEQTRDFTYIDNVVLANLLAATSEKPLAGEVVNIGTGARISLLQVLKHMGEVLKVDSTPTFGPPRAGDVRHSSADISQARSLLGYEPIVDFGEGIRRTLEWAGR
ncbi:MAG: NAD-dependent epimerase/dehydratase family protein [Phycisphaerales bacterium]